MNNYEEKIVGSLLKKYYCRMNSQSTSNRRIYLSVKSILKDYTCNTVDLREKDLVDSAISNLETRGFITSKLLKFSDDYEKVYLVESKIASLEMYAWNELNIVPRTFVVQELETILRAYTDVKQITNYYIDELKKRMKCSVNELDVTKEKDVLKILSFLEENENSLYLREASILIFSDSKYLEKYRKEQVGSFLTKYFVERGEDVFEDENLFERFNVYDIDQDICIKGPVKIDIDGKIYDIDGLNGGVSFSIKDIDKINSIQVDCSKVITVENKTSFLRMGGNCCYIYLGGFATKPQILFIKKLIQDNLNHDYYHFGDIDAGGFWIHKKLCEQTNYHFKLFHMGVETLSNTQYGKYTKELTESDVNRLKNLCEVDEYSQCIQYMLEHNVKLEQEIISLCEDCIF